MYDVSVAESVLFSLKLVLLNISATEILPILQGTNILSRKKIVQKSPHSTAGFIAFSPGLFPSFALLHTEKLVATCIVDPYNASRLPILQFSAK